MATLVVTQVTAAGAVDSLVAASAGGDALPNDGQCWLEVLNGSGAPITVTITPQSKYQGETIAPRAVVVPAAGRRKIGRFDSGIFNDANGNVAVTYSGVTTLTVGAFRL